MEVKAISSGILQPESDSSEKQEQILSQLLGSV